MQENGNTRRGFLSSLTKLLLLGIGAAIIVPAVRYALAPLRKKGGRLALADAGPIAELPLRKWHLVSLEVVQEDGWRATRTNHAVWVRREGDSKDDIIVLSSICPHLGCLVNWDPERSEFVCPCHRGAFDVTGQRISGPPPRNLDPLQDKEVRDGRLWVRWQDFKIGVDKPVEVNL
jgi:Rieske Fe-S protein